MSNKPTHILRHVVGEDDNSRSNRIGAAWPHKDGKGFNISLEYMPLKQEGFISMREVKKEDEESSS